MVARSARRGLEEVRPVFECIRFLAKLVRMITHWLVE
ncbi:hypothetical protein FHS38_004597 [Streptomyces netropsis]|uniref:Uncharacterized protein n=1 Tax=Streptomyces netropsis TaxID=55404 RepID=A0A7W7LF33_STRNE|nr:hypothetical protein [Streptomyces netropsis]